MHAGYSEECGSGVESEYKDQKDDDRLVVRPETKGKMKRLPWQKHASQSTATPGVEVRPAISSSSLRTAVLVGGSGGAALPPLPFPFPFPFSDFAGCGDLEGRIRSEGRDPREDIHGVPRRGGMVLVLKVIAMRWRCSELSRNAKSDWYHRLTPDVRLSSQVPCCEILHGFAFLPHKFSKLRSNHLLKPHSEFSNNSIRRMIDDLLKGCRKEVPNSAKTQPLGGESIVGLRNKSSEGGIAF